MMPRKRRVPRPDELELWRRVAASARPVSAKGFSRAASDPPGEDGDKDAPPPARNAPKPPDPIDPFTIGSHSRPSSPSGVHLSPSIAESLARQPVQMDARVFGRLSKGRIEPEARIDLHGMTLARARPALTGFVLKAHGAGRRLVLVITGKGRGGADAGPIPERRGVLRHQVPEWLRSGPLRPVVLQVSPAHRRHGGDGAYYVYLRRNTRP